LTDKDKPKEDVSDIIAEHAKKEEKEGTKRFKIK